MGCIEQKEKDPVPYIVFESTMARLERTIKRLWVLCIVIFLAFVMSNGAWIYYESSFEDVVTEVTQDNADGVNNYIGNDGNIINGTAENKDN